MQIKTGVPSALVYAVEAIALLSLPRRPGPARSDCGGPAAMPASHVLDAVMLTSVLAATVRLATPVLLAALGEMLAERGGVYNMGLEGTMLMGAFTAYLVAFNTGSPWAGVLAAAATGGMISLLFAFVAVTMRVEQIVAGLALNLLGSRPLDLLAPYGVRWRPSAGHSLP